MALFARVRIAMTFTFSCCAMRIHGEHEGGAPSWMTAMRPTSLDSRRFKHSTLDSGVSCVVMS